MSTRRPTMSMEGTIEVIDLTHASEEEAMATLLREIRSRREGRSGRPAGPAVVIDLGRLAGARDQPGSEAADHAPRAPGRAGGGRPEPGTQPSSFLDLADILRQMAAAPGDGAAPDSTEEREPAPDEVGARSEVEQFFARRTLIMEDDGGKMVAAGVVGFGLGAAAMFLARRFRYVAPSSSRPQRPRRPHPHIPSDAEWQAQLDEIARRYADPDGDEQDEDEPAPGK